MLEFSRKNEFKCTLDSMKSYNLITFNNRYIIDL